MGSINNIMKAKFKLQWHLKYKALYTNTIRLIFSKETVQNWEKDLYAKLYKSIIINLKSL